MNIRFLLLGFKLFSVVAFLIKSSKTFFSLMVLRYGILLLASSSMFLKSEILISVVIKSNSFRMSFISCIFSKRHKTLELEEISFIEKK